MTASRAHRRRPSPSLTHGVDQDAPVGGPWAGEAAQTVPVGPAAPAAPLAVSGPRLLRIVVPAQASRASGVRRTVAEQLSYLRLPAERLDNAVLATDELFANAVKYGSPDAGDMVTVTVECTDHEVRVTVADRSPDLPRHRTADVAEESGRGLAIVAALVDDWGIAPPAPGETGKRVWFSLEIQGVS
ncbi:ATP-binding protein [Streptomyces sp. NBC_00878]|uniref:ATP-binding protein n=1 Tax=Streptomyces sp. NBC_00878 TaxID=2975854 RepID=UPI00225B8490|nr:ATP-binding protein [Streptomyces sp. NBC_00878]MCX4903046.1 ATP-binding protein [Streptomyces sp. NBC_00878]